jgi:hypothetical protein
MSIIFSFFFSRGTNRENSVNVHQPRFRRVFNGTGGELAPKDPIPHVIRCHHYAHIENIIINKPVESSSPLEWPAVGGQLGLAAVSLLYSLS